jgi:hypothetical protein
MIEYSDGAPQAIRSTVYGIDSALALVIFAAVAFWFAVGFAVWHFF